MTLSVRALVERRLDLEFELPPGQTLAVLGPNGAGKSTLLDVLAGLVRPDAGRVALGPTTLLATGPEHPHSWTPPHARGVALLAQEALLFPHLSARDNVAFGPRSRGVPGEQARRVADEWLARMDASGLADVRPRRLSGGQAQRVAVARALATEPRLLLLDEPFGSLDAGAVPAMRALLSDVLTGRSVVLVTHDPLDALALADRVIVLDGGRIVEQGSTRDVLFAPRTPFTRMLTWGLRPPDGGPAGGMS